MNCRRIEKLIPLYVEGDLDIQQADRVRSHAKGCSNCGGLIAEYKESQRWLRTFAPPRFDDAILKELKLGVLEKINERETHASFLNRLIGNWTQRLVLAASVALLITFGLVALYVYQDKSDDTVAQDDVEQAEPSPEIVSRQKDVKKAPRASFSPKRRRYIAKRRANPERIIKRQEEAKAEPAVAVENGDEHSGDPAASQDMLRIEIQTSDPNIRIIWFSPKENNPNPSRPITETE